MGNIDVKFEGLDNFNRPVFREVGGKRRFGSVDVLCSYGSTRAEILAEVGESKLEYFGTRFNCEPEGGEVSGLRIVG